jgi:hypothetical protein
MKEYKSLIYFFPEVKITSENISAFLDIASRNDLASFIISGRQNPDENAYSAHASKNEIPRKNYNTWGFSGVLSFNGLHTAQF